MLGIYSQITDWMLSGRAAGLGEPDVRTVAIDAGIRDALHQARAAPSATSAIPCLNPRSTQLWSLTSSAFLLVKGWLVAHSDRA